MDKKIAVVFYETDEFCIFIGLRVVCRVANTFYRVEELKKKHCIDSVITLPNIEEYEWNYQQSHEKLLA